MASLPVLIIGRSGSGKTTSMRNFAHDEVAVINVTRKRLPFKGEFDSFLETDDYNRIVAAIKTTKKKAIVIDDAGYLITNYFMRNHANSNVNSFQLFDQMANDFWKLIDIAGGLEDPDKVVYFMMHEEGDEINGYRPKTMGKMLNDKVCVEGLFTIVLRAESLGDGKFVFRTRNNGQDVTKTPIGMFETEEIDNDLKAVDSTIRAFYNMSPLVAKGKKEER